MPTLSSCMSVVLALVLSTASLASAQDMPAPDLTLRGSITGDDAQTYRELPFTVPAGVTRISVSFRYTERDKKTSIDLGILDGERFRGWSGGNKSAFTLSETDATPSYLPGAIRPGVWKLLLGIPNIEQGVRSEYEAQIYFGHMGDAPRVSTFSGAPLQPGPAWYRGDLHMHDAHSDGSCLSQAGVNVPCPLYKTVEIAAARHLDFIAISDHNATSHYNQIRELQPYFDRLLLLPAREITTFHGHANIFGIIDFVDFRLGSATVPSINTLTKQVAAFHGIFSINHPGAPTGASCMGCGWTAADTDFRTVTAVEAINGGSLAGRGSGIPFWEDKLSKGFRLTAVGGSDNHEAVYPAPTRSAIAHPTTVVYASELSERAILDGIRSGRVFVDIDGTGNRGIEFSAKAQGGSVEMGGNLHTVDGDQVRFDLRMTNLQGAHPEIVHDEPSPLIFDETMTHFTIRSDGKRHWYRVNIHDIDGNILILGNPIYLNF